MRTHACLFKMCTPVPEWRIRVKYLFAIPGAGAGPREFIDWQDNLGENIVFRKILYNKGLTSSEPHIEKMEQAAAVVADEVMKTAGKDDDIFFFGHCMGASIAYESASLLARKNGIHIKGLFIAAFISPDVPILDGISGLSDEEFGKEIHSHGVFPEEFFRNESLLKLFLPAIRADYRLIEEYCDTQRYVLDCPIVGFFGEDDQMVKPEETKGWPEYTDKTYKSIYFPGDHYFYYDRQKEIALMIKEMIETDFGKNERSLAQMEEMIKELLAEIIEDDSAKQSWNENTDIINEIGIDSLQLVRFLLAVESRLGMNIDYEDLKFEYFSSIRALAEFLQKKVDSK